MADGYFVGTAGWNIPRAHRDRFAAHGSQLQRYASRLNAVEINTSFYRSHARAIYERWANAVPRDFRFAVKMPKLVTHERALARCRDPLRRFLDEIGGLGPKLGPLLMQLPPSFGFDARRVGRFFELMRTLHRGAIVCEPRHETWATDAASLLLQRFNVARVAADPPRAHGLGDPGGWTGIVYYRWHGSPRQYFSPYSSTALRALAARTAQHLAPSTVAPSTTVWVIFDNTGSGAAAGNALELASLV
ncbi:MAG TPA: DUF72 domain-containing protein [Vicinamibacterales bacterium]|nr:DUF72 domain-containing protein [Vicinamibacterales bacterium]